MFHANGSEGLQVTERNGFQKDAGEPAVSARRPLPVLQQGRHAGQTFEYNKDPNGAIYAIVRRDLATGRERRSSASRADRSRRVRPWMLTIRRSCPVGEIALDDGVDLAVRVLVVFERLTGGDVLAVIQIAAVCGKPPAPSIPIEARSAR